MNNTHKKMMAIMVSPTQDQPPFSDKALYQELSVLGRMEGLELYVFSPNKVNWNIRKVEGYKYCFSRMSWTKQLFPLPSLIYDRTFFHDQAIFDACRLSLRRLKNDRTILWLGHGLNSKWDVFKILQQNTSFLPYLPYTKKLNNEEIIPWFDSKKDLILKPLAGSQGKGVLHIHAHTKGMFSVKGRDHHNQMIAWYFSNQELLMQKIKRFINNRAYLLQQYLSLISQDGSVFDIRSLIQKDNQGTWQLTGMAIRKGQVGSLTANLHGGGTAMEVIPFLQEQFGKEKTTEIMNTLKNISLTIPSFLEQYYGRLVELGIDFGIEPTGEIWILEVNSKPGKSIFTSLNNKVVRIRSLHNPIRYARSILDRQLGG